MEEKILEAILEAILGNTDQESIIQIQTVIIRI